MKEPRFFVSELWGYRIHADLSHRTESRAPSVTATVFDRFYTPPAIRGSWEAGNPQGVTSKSCLLAAHRLCDRLNATELWPVEEDAA